MLEITGEIIADFRALFHEFSIASEFTDLMVTAALCEADKETGSGRWGTYSACSLKQSGLFNYAAHRLVIRRAVSAAVSAGGIGGSVGPTVSKSVGDESQSYAIPSSSNFSDIGNAGLASTFYGQEFIRLRRRAGMGAVAV